MLCLLFSVSNTQEPKKDTSKKTEDVKRVPVKFQQDTTKIDLIFIQQKTLNMELDSSLIKIKEQNAEMEQLLKEKSGDI